VTMDLVPIKCPVCANVPEWWEIESEEDPLCAKHAEELDPSSSPLVDALLGLNEPGVDKWSQWRKINGIVNLVKGGGTPQ
jgi:hypothetical protein